LVPEPKLKITSNPIPFVEPIHVPVVSPAIVTVLYSHVLAEDIVKEKG